MGRGRWGAAPVASPGGRLFKVLALCRSVLGHGLPQLFFSGLAVSLAPSKRHRRLALPVSNDPRQGHRQKQLAAVQHQCVKLS
eukprot:scaffold49477_cov47-Prasinocladus_malaysianus.AAC.1